MDLPVRLVIFNLLAHLGPPDRPPKYVDGFCPPQHIPIVSMRNGLFISIDVQFYSNAKQTYMNSLDVLGDPPKLYLATKDLALYVFNEQMWRQAIGNLNKICTSRICQPGGVDRMQQGLREPTAQTSTAIRRNPKTKGYRSFVSFRVVVCYICMRMSIYTNLETLPDLCPIDLLSADFYGVPTE